MLRYSPGLQSRLNSDLNLNKILVVGVDPGIMPTTTTIGTLNWLLRIVFHLVARVANVVSPNGLLQSTKESASDVLAAGLETTSLKGQSPKGLYLNGNLPKGKSSEAMDAKKRVTVWRVSLQYA